MNAASNTELTTKHSKHSTTGHCQTNSRNQFYSKSAENQSTLSRSLFQQYQTGAYQTSRKKFRPHNFNKSE